MTIEEKAVMLFMDPEMKQEIEDEKRAKKEYALKIRSLWEEKRCCDNCNREIQAFQEVRQISFYKYEIFCEMCRDVLWRKFAHNYVELENMNDFQDELEFYG